MAVLSTLKHHGSYNRTCLIYDNLCLYITPSHKNNERKLRTRKAYCTCKQKPKNYVKHVMFSVEIARFKVNGILL